MPRVRMYGRPGQGRRGGKNALQAHRRHGDSASRPFQSSWQFPPRCAASGLNQATVLAVGLPRCFSSLRVRPGSSALKAFKVGHGVDSISKDAGKGQEPAVKQTRIVRLDDNEAGCAINARKELCSVELHITCGHGEQLIEPIAARLVIVGGSFPRNYVYWHLHPLSSSNSGQPSPEAISGAQSWGSSACRRLVVSHTPRMEGLTRPGPDRRALAALLGLSLQRSEVSLSPS